MVLLKISSEIFLISFDYCTFTAFNELPFLNLCKDKKITRIENNFI
jgi:hypothetical protein